MKCKIPVTFPEEEVQAQSLQVRIKLSFSRGLVIKQSSVWSFFTLEPFFRSGIALDFQVRLLQIGHLIATIAADAEESLQPASFILYFDSVLGCCFGFFLRRIARSVDYWAARTFLFGLGPGLGRSGFLGHPMIRTSYRSVVYLY